MKPAPKKGARVEAREVSDADLPPGECPHCGSPNYTRDSYYFRDLQDLGAPGVARRVRHESVTWVCKDCGATFCVKHPDIPERTPYMPPVIEYAARRVLDRGDSVRRVARDLNELHNVKVSPATVLSWVNAGGEQGGLPTDFEGAGVVEDFSGVLGVDATFKAVGSKKKLPAGEGGGPLLLRLTRLRDGRLAVYWLEGKPRKRPPPSSSG